MVMIGKTIIIIIQILITIVMVMTESLSVT